MTTPPLRLAALILPAALALLPACEASGPRPAAPRGADDAGIAEAAPSADRNLPDGIEPRVSALFAELSGIVSARPRVRYQLVDTYDLPDDYGREIRYSHRRSGSLSRPDNLFLQVEGDLQNVTIWKQGATVTILDHDTNTYATHNSIDDINELMVLLTPTGAPRLPLGYFLEVDPLAALMKDVISAQHLGVHMVNESACDHVILSTPTVDRQLWIETEGKRRVVRMVEAWHTMPDKPQYELRLEISTLVDVLPDSMFEFVRPAGAMPAAGS